MPRGQPDYQSYREPAIAYQSVWMDDFEAPVLKWTPARSAGGTLPILSTTKAWKGIQSSYFVTAAVAGAYAELYRYFPLLRRGRIGIEFFVSLTTVTPGYLLAGLSIYDGANRADANLELDSQARTATIRTAAGPVPVATNCIPLAAFMPFFPVKLVVDMDTDRYVKLIIGPFEVDLSAHALVPVGLSTNIVIVPTLELVGGIAGIQHAYIDDFFLTQNES